MNDRWRPFDVDDAHPDPFIQFARWFDEGREFLRDPDAVTLATSTPDGHPSARMVLLRHVDSTSFGWFTNYGSRKGTELATNPRAALLWYCDELGRQIRIEGSVAPMSADESDAYFASRPRGHQIGAHASHQSHPIDSRADLEATVERLTASFEGEPIPRPLNWGGYRLTADHFEFWQHRADRLHDRVLYDPRADGTWTRQRYAP